MISITILGFIVASLAGTTYAEDLSIDYFDSAFQDSDITEAKRYRMAHAFLAGVSFLIIFPVGATILHSERSYHLKAHVALQCTGYAMYIIAAILGLKLVYTIRMRPDGDSLLHTTPSRAHPIIGLVLLAALFLQPSLGYLHRLRFKHLQRRTWISRVHIWLGRAVIVLGMANGVLGITFGTPSVELYFVYLMVATLMSLGWFVYYHYSKSEKEEKKKQAAARQAAAVVAAAALLNRQPPPPPQQQQQQQQLSVPPQAVTEPDRPFLRAQRSLQRYFRNRNAPYDDPVPPYSGHSVDGPPVYGEAVEMTAVEGSDHGRGCRAAVSSESLERGDPDSW